ncbi:MAG: pantoate--beta-alanine ligase [bacterium]
MKEIKIPKEMQEVCDDLRQKGKIGFVPTMGALHKGHLSLIEKAKKENDFLVLSIFVNPLQFGPQEDYKRYPRPYQKDFKLAGDLGVDYLFHPRLKDLYPKKQETFVRIPDFEGLLCGKNRPTHFQGVLTVVAKLFNIVKPHRAYFGQKDFQQAIIIKKMVAELNFDIEIKTLPIIREKDGLALSSRNAYLTKEERKKAPILYQSLIEGKRLLESKRPTKEVLSVMKGMIEKKGFEIDYIEILDKNTLKKGKTLIALACKIGKTRLIDNILV